MRVFILPSWCPTHAAPLAGSFFMEQAACLAEHRPDWQVAILRFDLAQARIPWRPWHWPRFAWRFVTSARCRYHRQGKLHIYDVFRPFAPRKRGCDGWQASTHALAAHARVALDAFTARFGAPDLIHAQACYPAGAAARLAAGGIPVVLSEHLGPFPPEGGGSLPALVTEAYAAATAHSAVSRALAERIMAAGYAPHVHVVPNFIEGGEPCKASRAKGAYRFLSVGGPSYAKGTDTLLEAFAALDGDATLSIIGDGPERRHYEALATQLGIAGRVRFEGAVARADMPARYAACDAFVLPSRGETFGVAFIEALAQGKPLIATRCGGPEDIVTEQNGVLVPVGDASALRKAMADMLLGHARYDAAALAGDFYARFSARAVVPQWVALYTGLALKNT